MKFDLSRIANIITSDYTSFEYDRSFGVKFKIIKHFETLSIRFKRKGDYHNFCKNIVMQDKNGAMINQNDDIKILKKIDTKKAHWVFLDNNFNYVASFADENFNKNSKDVVDSYIRKNPMSLLYLYAVGHNNELCLQTTFNKKSIYK